MYNVETKVTLLTYGMIFYSKVIRYSTVHTPGVNYLKNIFQSKLIDLKEKKLILKGKHKVTKQNKLGS